MFSVQESTVDEDLEAQLLAFDICVDATVHWHSPLPAPCLPQLVAFTQRRETSQHAS